MPSKFFRCILILLVSGAAASAFAADRELPRGRAFVGRQCGCCGCLHAFYDYHRELRSTYGTHMDPRNYDQAEPHYYFGRMRAYPHYYSDWGFESHY
jgi:hypothetical protein